VEILPGTTRAEIRVDVTACCLEEFVRSVLVHFLDWVSDAYIINTRRFIAYLLRQTGITSKPVTDRLQKHLTLKSHGYTRPTHHCHHRRNNNQHKMIKVSAIGWEKKAIFISQRIPQAVRLQCTHTHTRHLNEHMRKESEVRSKVGSDLLARNRIHCSTFQHTATLPCSLGGSLRLPVRSSGVYITPLRPLLHFCLRVCHVPFHLIPGPSPGLPCTPCSWCRSREYLRTP
jgi:hypothetical protein